jgi:menaquinone-dependent protoporphyrinogen oxidase
MKIAVVYSSRHGHVRAIAERLAQIAAIRHVECRVTDVRYAGSALEDCGAAVIAGSVHFGKHARALRRFVEKKLAWLTANPSVFLSVSGSAATLEGAPKAEAYMHDFQRATGWQPQMSLSVAGAVLYTRYDPFTRLMMKFASRTAGRESDPTRDVIYTNWLAVDDFMHQFLDSLERHACAMREKERARA